MTDSKRVQFATTRDGGHPVFIDVPRLIETRLLVQASSGGGKSYAVRKLLEVTHGHVQHLVIDADGEYSSLRQKFEYLMAGKGGDVPTEPRSAALLAEKLLELGVDTILDVYELHPKVRRQFAGIFLETLINLPKSLWHPTLVVVDEAHIFCPEAGESVALEPVIDLASRGRKREYAAVLATQRLSKLHKDAAAECQNKLIGLANLDIDRKRAGAELGFRTHEDVLSLRSLDPGEMYVVGPAFLIGGKPAKDPVIVRISEVVTPHGRKARQWTPRKGTESHKVKAALAKLSDLPAEAEQEARDRESMTKRIRELEREVKEVRRGQPKVDPAAIERAEAEGYRKAKRESEQIMKSMNQFKNRLQQKLKEIGVLVDQIPEGSAQAAPARTAPAAPVVRLQVPAARAVTSVEVEGRTFGACDRKILGFLSLRPGEFFTKVQVGALTGYSHGSGGFNNALSNLAQAGLILRQGGSIALNPEADVAELVDATPHRLEDWVSKLGACERAVYSLLLENPDTEYPKEEVAQATGYSAGSGGFNNALSRLSTLGLIQRAPGGLVQLNPAVQGIQGGV